MVQIGGSPYPPGTITFFSIKNGDIPWVGHKYSVITLGMGVHHGVIIPRVGTATAGDNPREGHSLRSDNPWVGHARRVMSLPIPGGGMGHTDLNHTLHQ